MAPPIVKNNPNAATATGSGGVGVLVVWALNKWADASLNPEEAVLVAGGITSLVLLVGRKGLKAILHGLWLGA